MPLDPRTPVLVGCGQIKQRVDDVREGVEPLELMVEAAERAADDAGSRSLLPALDSIRVPRGLWRYSNPAALLRERFGCPSAETGLGPISGSTVQRMLSHAAQDVVAGRRDVVLLVGAEAEHSKRRGASQGVPLDWTEQQGDEPDESFGTHSPEIGPWERKHRIRPIQAFALFENALRYQRGETIEEHRQRIGRLWSRFSEVASGNPYAWITKPKTADEILTPSDDNRLVAFPYTKYLVSNMVVDLGAALILCSVEAARRQSIPESRWIFPHAATDIFGSPPVAERTSLHDEPALGAAGRRALELAGIAPNDVAHVDLYSCFPSAVQIAAEEIGFGTDRQLTQTGGLTFSGGPFNSYVLHAIATLVLRLRDDPGSRGFLSSVGGYMAKHAFGVYGSEPPVDGFRYEDMTGRVTTETLRWDEAYTGPVQIEAFTQLSPREGPECLLVACRIDAGRRIWATTDDPSLPASVQSEELCGRTGTVRAGAILDVV